MNALASLVRVALRVRAGDQCCGVRRDVPNAIRSRTLNLCASACGAALHACLVVAARTYASLIGRGRGRPSGVAAAAGCACGNFVLSSELETGTLALLGSSGLVRPMFAHASKCCILRPQKLVGIWTRVYAGVRRGHDRGWTAITRGTVDTASHSHGTPWSWYSAYRAPADRRQAVR